MGEGQNDVGKKAQPPLLAWKTEGGATSQGMWAPLEAGRARKQILPQSLQKALSPANTLAVAQ